eukprot:1276623-Rhodomonas_salina.1
MPPSAYFPFYEMRAAAKDLRGLAVEPTSSEVINENSDRLHAQFKTLMENGGKHVILSAFGCGAFQNDPAVMAAGYAALIKEYKDNFKDGCIVFAIHNAGYDTSNNFEIFFEVLQQQGVLTENVLPFESSAEATDKIQGKKWFELEFGVQEATFQNEKSLLRHVVPKKGSPESIIADTWGGYHAH